MNKNKQFILETMKSMSDHITNLFKDMKQGDETTFNHPLIFFKEETNEKYRCFSPKYFEMYNISFKTSADGIKEYFVVDTVNQSSDYYTAYMVYLADDNTVLYDERCIGTDQKQINAMKDIIEFFTEVCKSKWLDIKI